MGRSCVWEVLTRWAVESEAADALEELARKPGFDAGSARRRLDDRFLRLDDPLLPRDVLRNDRVLWLSLSRRWIAGESPTRIAGLTKDRAFLGSWLVRPLAYRDALQFLDLARQGIRLAEETPREALPKARELMDEYRELGPLNLVCHQAAVEPYHVLRHCLRHQAVLRVVRTGLAVLATRQDTGRWPASLDAVIPMVGSETIIDPHNGERLEYEPGVRLEAATSHRLESDRIVWHLPP
jgi:hypothetical protein